MGNLKVVHLADLHLGFRAYARYAKSGVNQREEDVCRSFSESVNNIIEISPDVILVAGDVFHSVRPSNAIIKFA